MQFKNKGASQLLRTDKRRRLVDRNRTRVNWENAFRVVEATDLKKM
jgi:hypothetical protein